MKTLSLNRQSIEKAASPGWTLDLKTHALIALVVLADVAGNVMMSWGLKHHGALIGGSPLVYLRLIFDPWIVLATSFFLFWFLARMILLGWADLSYVLPMTSFSYVLSSLAGHYVLGEEVDWSRWAGTLLITAGAAVVGRTRSNTTAARKGPIA